VLYKIIATAATTSFDIPGLLKQCATRLAMRTDWALKQNTSCPPIPLGASITDLTLQMGDAPLIANSSRPKWAWSTLLQTGDLMAQPELLEAVVAGQVLGYSCFKHVMLHHHHHVTQSCLSSPALPQYSCCCTLVC
jgi:hypothetical protein